MVDKRTCREAERTTLRAIEAGHGKERETMRHLKIFGVIGALVALLGALGLSTGRARAANTVEVTYDLSDTDLLWEIGNFKHVVSNADDSFSGNEDQVGGIVSGSMKVRYVSNSSSGMPIEHGPATLLTFNLTVVSLEIPYNAPYLTLSGTFHWQLTTPAFGSFASTSALTGVNANLRMTGRANCGFPAPYSYYCFAIVGLPTFTIYPNYFRSGPISVAGSAGPNGGALSTRHTLTGRGRAVGWQPGAGLLGLGYDFVANNDVGGVYLVGREVLREAEGHDPKITPEPGTLLLLGAGAAGLALVGRATRRSQPH